MNTSTQAAHAVGVSVMPGHSTLTYVMVFAAVALFIYRNMRPQKLTAARLWILPAFLILMTVFSVGSSTLALAPGVIPPPGWMIAAAVLLGLCAGIPLGLARGKASTVRLAEKSGAMIVEPSILFAAIWLVAFAIRFGLRSVLPSAGGGYFAFSDGSIVFAASSIVALRYVLYTKFKALHLETAQLVEV